MFRKEIMREAAGEFFTLRIEIREDSQNRPVLSLTGNVGHVLSEDEAESEARDFWTSFFEECPEEKMTLIESQERYMTDEQAAEFVLQVDGRFHGLDVVQTSENKVYVSDAGGCLHAEMAEWFPEMAPFVQYHLNDMNAGCPKCGHKYGSEWLYEEIPNDVIEFLKNFEG